jgi:hypothetical protein
MKDLDQLIEKISLSKEINKKQVKKFGGKEKRGSAGVQKGSWNFSTG